MTQLDLDELQRLADEATPGEWSAQDAGEDCWEVVNYIDDESCSGVVEVGHNPEEHAHGGANEADAAFIAAAREAVPDLIREVRQLRANLDEAEKRHAKLRSALSCVHANLTTRTVAIDDLVKILQADFWGVAVPAGDGS